MLGDLEGQSSPRDRLSLVHTMHMGASMFGDLLCPSLGLGGDSILGGEKTFWIFFIFHKRDNYIT